MRVLHHRAALPLATFVVTAAVYVAVGGTRTWQPSADNHYVHLAHSYLNGQLSLVEDAPPGTNDWACYDTVEHGPCPMNTYSFTTDQRQRYQWYVSFPPLPALVIVPVVAAFGTDIPDRLFWSILAGFGPALLLLLLRFLRETERSTRSPVEDGVLTTLFAFGTVYFFTAVQGTVWFAAQVVAVPLIILFVLWGLGARRPVWAGLALGLVFLARPTALFLAPLFIIEALGRYRREGAPAAPEESLMWTRAWFWLRGAAWRPALRSVALFGAPILAVGIVAMILNTARFEDPFEFGHTFLQIRWRPRIEKWGLFNYHYFGKNLAVFLAALPWLSALPPFLKVSRHGLALWVTTPNLLQTLAPRKLSVTVVGLYAAVIVVAVLDLCYQNSGWVQFGYRFALDYMVLLFVLLAMGVRRFGPGFYLMMAFALVVNTFGAITFDRAMAAPGWQFYDGDSTQSVIFQPD